MFLISCSSTSQSQRYNKPKEEDGNTVSKSVRFTSKDDEQENKSGITKTHDPSEIPYEFDVPPVEDHPVDKKEFVDKYDNIKTLSAVLTTREKILVEIISYLKTPYVYGGNDHDGIDCSAFTQNVFSTSIGVSLPRTASEQFNVGNEIDDEESLRFGDLIFFNTSSRSYPGHVGIYLGEDLFAHASRSLGVTVSSLKSTYYKTRLISGKRVY